MNKKGMALSINTIIILIIAIVTLGIILGFITGFFPKIFDILKGWPQPQFPATPDNPISFIPMTVQRGQETRMTIDFYNNEQAIVPDTVKPVINCEGITSVNVRASGLNIPVGSSKEYRALVSVPTDTAANDYPCTIKISNTEDTFFMNVK